MQVTGLFLPRSRGLQIFLKCTPFIAVSRGLTSAPALHMFFFVLSQLFQFVLLLIFLYLFCPALVEVHQLPQGLRYLFKAAPVNAVILPYFWEGLGSTAA